MSSERTPIDRLDGRSQSLASEVVGYLKHNGKWWLAPILIVFVLFGVLMLLGGSAAAPFIYTLF
jgi:hypothetical protein